jgi:carbamoyl-phosphate synthase large subunit
VYAGQVKTLIATEAIDLAIIVPEPEVLAWTDLDFPVPALLPPVEFARLAADKAKLYEVLEDTGLVPGFTIHSREELQLCKFADLSPGEAPVWLRDHSVGSTSGKGALLVTNADELRAWVTLNPGISSFMISEFLPGRNFAQCMLFHEGKLLKTACYQRLEYFMGHLVPSGVSGNISRGRLVNEAAALENSLAAIEAVARQTGEEVHGLVTVDLRENEKGQPLITEINLRHTAATSAFAAGGANMVEAHVLATLGRTADIDSSPVEFPPDNLILRDIDGAPLWVPHAEPIEIGGQYRATDCKRA